ncbi:amidohydrolase family protein [uncultured Tateyamaria sp.]|uniref:amidohydrolase family protein n=1 Tax=uncultured Tateyamaria sp. TaxID=455651 RepID=UPI00263056FF|nr:amidohydrolase family protein [uncultured Tateyamaria sp.]
MSVCPKIDAHQHFWQISRGDYDWMTDAVADIRHDILPANLSGLLAQHEIAGTVVVQAAATVAETEFLLGLAKDTPFIKGVVGWVDLADPTCPVVLDRLMASPVFKGVRPMLQDIEDTDWISRPTVRTNLTALADRGLRLDALVVPRHLDVLACVAADLPQLPIVIDHCAKPVIADGADAGETWRGNMARLAALPNLMCKLSGLANEAGPGWSAATLQPIVDHVVKHFGPERIMWGSDWPVLNLAGDYAQWCAVSDQLVADLSDQDKANIYGATATRFYGLELSE